MDVSQRINAQASEAAPPQQVHYGLLAQQRDTLKDQILASKQLKRCNEQSNAGLAVDVEKVKLLQLDAPACVGGCSARLGQTHGFISRSNQNRCLLDSRLRKKRLIYFMTG